MLFSYPVKVLIIDDDEDDFFIIQDSLNMIGPDLFETDWCNKYKESLQKIIAGYYDIFFVDYKLGNETGLELLKEAIESGCEQPIIMLTGKGNKNIDMEAMRLGATDYIIKSELTAEKLERCIRYAIERSIHVKSLKESEQKYRYLFESSTDAVFIADEQLKFIELNPAAASIFTFHAADVPDQTLYNFIVSKEQVKFIRHQLSQNRNIQNLEISIYSKDNTVLTCQLFLSINTKSHQKLIHGIIHDITSLRTAENSKIQIERFAANERLIRIMAHEIRNPLNNIRLAIDNLQSMDKEDEDQLYLEIIERNTNRINQLISELLDFSKPVELVSQEVSLQHVVEKSLSETMDRMQLKKIQLVKEYTDDPCNIIADKQKLSIALCNIIINAIESMDTGNGRLLVRIADSPEYFFLQIEDNGKGIPEEFLSRITEPFFTLKSSGMGIGLAAAFSILKSHCAHMEVRSKVGVGTQFIVRFEKATALSETSKNMSLSI